MATSISINTLRDDSNGVIDFITLAASNTILTNNLIRASTLRRIFNDNRFYSTIIQDGAIPLSKISGSIEANSIATQSLSGAIGKDLNPARNGQIAWYTITQENLAHNTIFWNSSKKVGINNSNPSGSEALFIGGDNENTGLRISKWTSLRTLDGTGRVNWYANADTVINSQTNLAQNVYLNSEGASKITQTQGGIFLSCSSDSTIVAGNPITWNDTLTLNSLAASFNVPVVVGGNVGASSFSLQNSTLSIVYDSTNQSVGFNRGTTRILDLYSNKAIFSKENMTIGSQANRLINSSYGIFDRITASNNIVYYRVSTTTLLNGQGDAQRDILTATPANGRVGIGGDPDTIGSAALKVTGNVDITSDLKVTGNLTVGSLSLGSSQLKAGSIDVRDEGGTGALVGNRLFVSGDIEGSTLKAQSIDNYYNLVPSGTIINIFYQNFLRGTKVIPWNVNYLFAPSDMLNDAITNVSLGYTLFDNIAYTKKITDCSLRIKLNIPVFYPSPPSGVLGITNIWLILYNFSNNRIIRGVVKEFAAQECNPLELEYIGDFLDNPGGGIVRLSAKIFASQALDSRYGFRFNGLPNNSASPWIVTNTANNAATKSDPFLTIEEIKN